MPRQNPSWTEEELILAYDVLIRLDNAALRSDHPEIISLSKLLNSLPIHARHRRVEPFRDPDGVRRRLAYLRQIESGQDVENREAYKQVVQKYKDQPEALHKAVQKIRRKYRCDP